MTANRVRTILATCAILGGLTRGQSTSGTFAIDTINLSPDTPKSNEQFSATPVKNGNAFSIQLSYKIPSQGVSASAAFTFTAPATAISGSIKNLVGSTFFVPDSPVTIPVAVQYTASPTQGSLLTFLTRYSSFGTTATSCTPTKNDTCSYAAFPATTAADGTVTIPITGRLELYVDSIVPVNSIFFTANFILTQDCPSTVANRDVNSRINVCGNTIKLGPTFPYAGDPILIPTAGQTGSIRSPEFVARADYKLLTKDKGVVSLELRNQDGSGGTPGKLIGLSTGVNISKGTGTVGNSKPFLLITPFNFSAGQVPIDDSNTKELLLRAIISDPATGAVLATSDAVHFPATSASITISLLSGLFSAESGSFQPVDPSQVALNATGPLNRSSSEKLLRLRVAYKIPTGLKANLNLRATASSNGKLKSTTADRLNEEPLSGSATTDFSFPSQTVEAEVDLLSIAVAMTLTDTGQTILSNPLPITVNQITITTVTPGPPLFAGVTNQLHVQLTAVTRESGLLLVRHVIIAPTGSTRELIRMNDYVSQDALTPSRPLTVMDSFPITAPTNRTGIAVFYTLNKAGDELTTPQFGPSSRSLIYKQFMDVVSNALLNGFIFANGQVKNLKSTFAKPIRIAYYAGELLTNPGPICEIAKYTKIPPFQQSLLRLACPPGTFPTANDHAFARRDAGPAGTASALTLQTWTFDPQVPADGTVAGDLSFSYGPNASDDPNFDASKLQIFAIDGTTGQASIVASSVDTVNQTVTAHVSSFNAGYSLGVVGPFTNSSLAFSDGSSASTVSLVNLATVPVPVTLRGSTATGDAAVATPPSIAVPATQQFVGLFSKAFPASVTDLGWVRADASNTQLVGAEVITDGQYFDVLPAAMKSSPGPWVVTAAERSDLADTELRITNTGTQTTTVDIFLQKADGSDQGVYEIEIDPKQQLNGVLTAFFPDLPDSFQGYAMVWADHPIVVSQYLIGAQSRAALNAQVPLLGQNSVLYAPRLGGSSGITMLTLVNGTTSAASVSIKGFGPNGATVGTAASISIAPGQQYRQAISDVLGITDTQTGTLLVTSNQPGLVGHLDVIDMLANQFRATMPLDAAPAKTAAIPYVAQSATAAAAVSVSNVSGTSANVTVKAFNSSGVQIGAKSVTLAANAQISDQLVNLIPAAASLTTGYVTITSDQPVTSAAALTSGNEMGLLPAQPVTLGGASSGGPTPQISGGGVVNAASFATKLVRGGLGSIFGSNLAQTTASAPSIPWLTTLGGVNVYVGGVLAPLYFVSSGQINFQVPFEVPAGSSTTVMVVANGVASPSVPVALGDYGVGIFTYARTASAIDPIIVHATTNALVTPANPAVPNEALVAYATGIGKLTTTPTSGAGSPFSPLATAVDTPTAALGGTPIKVLFAGLTPGFVGLVQLNLQLGASHPTGNLPLVISSPGDTSTTVNLAVAGNVASVPQLSLSASTLAFGSVTVGQTKDLTLTISNTGSAALAVSALNVTGAAFRVVSPVAPFNIATGSSQTVTVRFSPSAASSSAGTLAIASNDPSQPSANIALTGTGTAAAAPSIDVSPNSLDFGSVTVSQSKDLPVTLRNTGSAALSVTSIISSNARFTLPVAGSVTISAGGSIPLTVRFTPSAAGAQSGTVTFASNDPARPSVAVTVTGTGAGSAVQTLTLAVDDGTFESNTGFPSGAAAAWFVNRITPPSYPATLKQVQIYFTSGQLPVGTPITLDIANNPSGAGGAQLSGLSFQRGTSSIAGLDAFNVFTVTPVTIQSGDFVVGFTVANPAATFPMATDTTPPSKTRSYISTNGTTFTLLDTAGASGNFGIRAVVDVGGSAAAHGDAFNISSFNVTSVVLATPPW